MPGQQRSPRDRPLIGLDVGSTTVKAVCVEAATGDILWSDYQRHETRQAEKTLELLQALEVAVPGVADEGTRLFLTGSGSKPLAAALGGQFVQEVNAVTLAVETLHPDVSSVVELGGQDAKVILFQENPESGERQAICSMNDKCASGTGATIDKGLLKMGMPADQVGRLGFDPTRLHKVAAKCGVFAETDIVNLVKAGVPASEVLCSLGDAIVAQNLSVLTRGNTLKPKVLLLGGPNTYLPFLRECWRLRIPETWEERGYDYASEACVEELVVVPDNAQYYAAYGAVVYGLDEPVDAGLYRGAGALEAELASGRGRTAAKHQGRPLVNDPAEVEAFARRYSVPIFEPATFEPGERVRAVIGLDGGSTSSKAVLVDEDGAVLAKAYRLSQGNPIEDARVLLVQLRQHVAGQDAELEVLGFGATGYAADVLEESLGADVNIVETVAHQMSAVHQFGEVDVICDIGGQDIKVLFLHGGEIRDFRLSNQCSAGNGMLLQAMADQFGVPIERYAETAFRAELSPTFSYGCAVFLDADRVNFQKEGYSREQLLAGLASVLPKNVWQYVVQVPRMAELGRHFVLQGGTQYNLAAVKAQVDYIEARVPGARVHVHPHCGEAGAIGAAIETLRVISRRGHSTFVGLDEAIDLDYTTRNDESTRCHFCPNLCSRTFVDTRAASGRTGRYISGFSCERGTVESKEALRDLVRHRKRLKERHVNLVEYEARLAFRHFHSPAPLPPAGRMVDDVEVSRGLLGNVRRRPVRRGFKRSSRDAAQRRAQLRIGMPRVLNLYSTAPLFRTYFEALGVPPRNVRFSPVTSEELFQAGAKYGAVDPCYPSKVVQAHIHHLLFEEREPLDYVFFPTLTHVPTFVERTMDTTSCPIVAGTPNVIKAAFTKEIDFFDERGAGYVDAAVNLAEPAYFKRQMFEAWGERLRISEDESDFAVEEGWKALARFTEDLERRGLELIEAAEESDSVVLLLLGRPYHSDPGINHQVLEDFQALGYPVISIRSIPKDQGWLGRWFRDDIDRGRIGGPLEIGDVWPENYSSNSVQKVWAAKFAARHPNVAVLDLSSFKCGHDAPTYGLVDDILKAGRTPFMTLHDIDANKAPGSQKIRVKTFAHTLSRYEEDLADRKRRLGELERSVAARRRELIAARRAALERAARADDELRHRLDEMARAFDTYLAEEETVLGVREADLARPFPAGAPLGEVVADVAPLPPELSIVGRSAVDSASACGCSSGGDCATEAPIETGLVQIGSGMEATTGHYQEDTK